MGKQKTPSESSRGPLPLTELERIIGYCFENSQLLVTALTAPSYRGSSGDVSMVDNQRLEFLGDAVLGLVITQKLYSAHSDDDEGSLTIRRSQQVSGKALAHLARQIGLERFIRRGKCENTPGCHLRDSLLADTIEAIFGAAWCDGGLAAATAIHDKLAPLICLETQGFDPWSGNPKGRLQELCQHHAWPDSPLYELTATTGSDHQPTFTVKVKVYGGYAATGSGTSKRKAEMVAASTMLQTLDKLGFIAKSVLDH